MSDSIRPLFIGTFPEAGIGTDTGLGEGVWTTGLDLVTGEFTPVTQVAATPAPSFLVASADLLFLYATAESDPNGQIASFAIDDAATGLQLASAGRVSSAGSSPTHLVEVDGLLIAANYGDGTVGALPLGLDGMPTAGAIGLGHTGSGPVEDRQEGPHAHSTTITPDGRFALVADLGTDELRRYLITRDDSGRAVGLEERGVAYTFEPGAGPRHAVFSPSGRQLHVSTELSAELVSLSWNPALAEARLLDRQRAAATSETDGQPSHIALSSDGDLLYLANRGLGTISVFRLSSTGGKPVPVGEVGAGSDLPRHFAVIPGSDGAEFIVVAEQLTGELRVLRRLAGSDTPELLPGRVAVPSAAFVLPL